MPRYRVQWIETSNVPGNFGWAHGRMEIVPTLKEAIALANLGFKAGVTDVHVDLLKEEPARGAYPIAKRARKGLITFTNRGKKLLETEVWNHENQPH